MLSPRSFITLGFNNTYGFVIYFKLIFMKAMKSVSRFIFFNMDVQLFEYHLLKRLSLLHCIAFAPLSKSVDYISRLCFWTLFSVPLTYLFFHQYHTVLITVSLKVKYCQFFNFVLLLQLLCWLFCLLFL